MASFGKPKHNAQPLTRKTTAYEEKQTPLDFSLLMYLFNPSYTDGRTQPLLQTSTQRKYKGNHPYKNASYFVFLLSSHDVIEVVFELPGTIYRPLRNMQTLSVRAMPSGS